MSDKYTPLFCVQWKGDEETLILKWLVLLVKEMSIGLFICYIHIKHEFYVF